MKPLVHAGLAGLATGARSFSALAACARTPGGAGRLERLLHRPRVRRSLRSSAALEVVGDKLPAAPPRTSPSSLTSRIVIGAVTGAVVARRHGGRALSGGVVGAATSTAWTFAGARYRAALAAGTGSDLAGAVVEDVAAHGLARVAAG